LIANTGQFTKKMKLSEKTLQRFESAVGNVAKMAARFGVVAATAAAGGLTLLTKNAMANIDATAKLSDRLGVSTEFLAALGHEAKIAGTNQETLAKGIQYMLKNIGEANMGLKSYQDAFTMLGMDYKRLKAASPEDAFLQIAKRIRDAEDASVRMSATMRIFGRSGSQLLNLMQGDLDGVVDRAKDLGITFSRAQGRMVESANDAVANMKAAFSGLGQSIAVSISGSVEYAAGAITRMLRGKSYELAAFQSELLKTQAAFIGKLQSVVHVFRGRSLGIGNLVEPFYQTLESVKDDLLLTANKKVSLMDRLAQEAVDKYTAAARYIPAGIGQPETQDASSAASKTFSFAPSAREIDSSMVSVSGLSMQGKEYTYERRQVSLLESCDRTLKKIANQEALN
ncbi:MAG: hypothetical protein OEV87_12285, partial [Phycisphaerae bacterium]|nr:hypothetical protein [Phycisphaerae bacterium]